MKFQLFLLFALVGTFSTTVYASTLVVPTEAQMTHKTQTPLDEHVTEPSQTEKVTAKEDTSPTPASSTVFVTEEPPVTTDAPVGDTEVPVATTWAVAEETEPATTQVEHTDKEELGGAEPTSMTELVSGVTSDFEVGQETGTNVVEVIEDGMTTGHVVGIVFGALLAIAILIAVIIVVVRRMGHYSP
ncbi:podoplanin [Brachyhypopomus gauderio]|uniref:podoplanin n=1 Tax=Brachyhypopomus gauderio TaxID=698409 RepID=UPI0040425F25